LPINKPPPQDKDITMNTDDIKITEVEHEDGSVSFQFEMSDEYTNYFAKVGIVRILEEAVAAMKEQEQND
jgi:hypothetical protein